MLESWRGQRRDSDHGWRVSALFVNTQSFDLSHTRMASPRCPVQDQPGPRHPCQARGISLLQHLVHREDIFTRALGLARLVTEQADTP